MECDTYIECEHERPAENSLSVIFFFRVIKDGYSCEKLKVQNYLDCQYWQEEKVQILVKEYMLLKNLNKDIPVYSDVLAVISYMENIYVVSDISLPFDDWKKWSYYKSPYQDRFYQAGPK